MSATLYLATALMAQAPATLTVPAPAIESGDVGYGEIMAGRPRAAISRIEGSDLLRKQDPLAMINLGTAYKLVGEREKAAKLYRGAASSDQRYDVELSDGRWIDSRRAASLAMKQLDTNEVLALR